MLTWNFQSNTAYIYSYYNWSIYLNLLSEEYATISKIIRTAKDLEFPHMDLQHSIQSAYKQARPEKAKEMRSSWSAPEKRFFVLCSSVTQPLSSSIAAVKKISYLQFPKLKFFYSLVGAIRSIFWSHLNHHHWCITMLTYNLTY